MLPIAQFRSNFRRSFACIHVFPSCTGSDISDNSLSSRNKSSLFHPPFHRPKRQNGQIFVSFRYFFEILSRQRSGWECARIQWISHRDDEKRGSRYFALTTLDLEWKVKRAPIRTTTWHGERYGPERHVDVKLTSNRRQTDVKSTSNRRFSANLERAITSL